MAKKSKSTKKSINKQVKHIGIICACFAIFQAVVIAVLALTGIICFFIKCGANRTANSFQYVYHNKKFKTECPMTITKPPVYFVICILYILVCILWIVFSIFMIRDFRTWKDVASVKKAANRWTKVTLGVLAFDCLMYILFVVDIFTLDPKCQNLGIFFSGIEPDLNSPKIYYSPNRKIISTTEIQATLEVNNVTEEEDSRMLNPFLYNKMNDQVSWPIKVKSKKINKSDRSILPHRRETYIDSLFQMHNLKSINAPPVKRAAYLPPLISMLVAIKLFLAWVANLLLLVYFRVKLAGLKRSVIAEGLKGFFARLKPCKRAETKKKSKKRKKSKKGSCSCGAKRRKPKRKKKKKKKAKPKKKKCTC